MEYLDVLTETGEFTGKSLPRSEIHKQGLWHRAAHVWIINSKGDILLQKRSMQKGTDPGKWDISAAGHISAGESKLEGARKEVREELGLDVSDADLLCIATINQSSSTEDGKYVNKEVDDIYVLRMDPDISSLKLQHEEVEAVAWVSFQELKDRVNSGDPTLVHQRKEYETLFKWIEGNITPFHTAGII